MGILESCFHIKDRGSSMKQELLGGITTFFTSAYLIVLIADYIVPVSEGTDSAVMTAVCISAAIGCLIIGFVSNLPFAAAPGLGFAVFFAHTLAGTYGYSYQQAVALVFLSGILFLIISLFPLRERLLDAVPLPFKFAVSAGLGLMITFSGLVNAGLITAENNLLDMGNIISPGPLLALFGVFLTAALLLKKVPGAVLIGIFSITALGIPMKVTRLPEEWISGSVISMVFPDFGGIFSCGVLPVISALLALSLSQCFDAVGTFLGVTGDAKMTDNTGNLDGSGRAMAGAAVSTCIGVLVGVPGVTPLAESAVGVREGARTGFASVITGLLFLAAIPLAPLVGVIPSAATAAVRIVVGMMMMSGISQIRWKHVEISLPCFLIIAGMPFTGSITNGIALGCISYVVLMVCRKRANIVNPWMYALAGLFILMYLLAAL